MNKQEVFNTVVTHLRKQGVRAVKGDPSETESSCMYRTPEGNKCALGALIPDEDYQASFEGKNAYVVVRQVPSLEYMNNPDGIEFLYNLQNIHDSFLPEEWEERFAITAEQYHLTIP